MSRIILCALLLCGVCVAIPGCRRGSAKKQTPIDAAINDLLKGPREPNIVFDARPNERKVRLWKDDIYELDKKFQGQKDQLARKLKEVIADQEKLEQDSDSNKIVEAGKKAADDKESELEHKAFKARVVEFYKLKKDSPKDFSFDSVYKYFLRGDYYFSKKYVDKVSWEIVEEHKFLVNYLDKSAFGVTPAVDTRAPINVVNPDTRHQYIAGFRGGGPDTFTWDGKEGPPLKDSELTTYLRLQELRILRLYFVKYASPLLVRQQPNDTVVQSMVYGNPWEVLRSVDQNTPMLAKNPPEERDQKKFEAYLKDNAPPFVLEYLKDRFFSLNFKVDLRNDRVNLQNIVACRTIPFETEDPTTKAKSVWNHVVFSDGSTGAVPAAVVQAFRQELPQKTEPTPGSGGGGGFGGGMGLGMPGMK